MAVVGALPASPPMKKGQKRFSPGTKVKFKLWQGSVVDYVAEVIADGKKTVWVRCGRIYVLEVSRDALTVIQEGGK